MLIDAGVKRICPKCSSNRFWSLKDGRFRCTKCRKTFSDFRKKISISQIKLRTVIQEFLLEHSTNIILTRVDISKYMLLKILTLLRVAMTQDVPEAFEGTVEVDETYIGGQLKNKRISVKRNLTNQSVRYLSTAPVIQKNFSCFHEKQFPLIKTLNKMLQNLRPIPKISIFHGHPQFTFDFTACPDQYLA